MRGPYQPNTRNSSERKVLERRRERDGILNQHYKEPRLWIHVRFMRLRWPVHVKRMSNDRNPQLTSSGKHTSSKTKAVMGGRTECIGWKPKTGRLIKIVVDETLRRPIWAEYRTVYVCILSNCVCVCCLGVGVSMTRDCSTLMVAQYFKRRREFVEIFIVSGSGLGIAIMSAFIKGAIRYVSISITGLCLFIECKHFL